jgi:hypothetical protein
VKTFSSKSKKNFKIRTEKSGRKKIQKGRTGRKNNKTSSIS